MNAIAARGSPVEDEVLRNCTGKRVWLRREGRDHLKGQQIVFGDYSSLFALVSLPARNIVSRYMQLLMGPIQ